MEVISRSASCFNQARKIFGGIIEDAFIVANHYGDIVYTTNRIREQEEYIAKTIDNYDDIILVFTNGRNVRFTTSEWATMVKVNLSDFTDMNTLSGIEEEKE